MSCCESVLIIVAVIMSHNLIVLVSLLLFGLAHSAQVPWKGLHGWCTFMAL